MKRVTMQDIADLAGVSKNTVSRALNDKPEISGETKLRIRRIAKQLNYIPNHLARGLTLRSTKTLGVIVSDNANPFYARMIKGIEDTARGRGYNIILCNTDEDYEREREAIKLLCAKRVDGLLITPAQKRDPEVLELINFGIPFVLLNRHVDEADVDYVINDNALGGYLATSHLIDRGHRRIGYLISNLQTSSAQERLEGYKRALGEGGIEYDSGLVKECCLDVEGGCEGAKELLKSSDRPTAIFAYDDLLAVGVLKAAREMGFKIPRDLAVVGYDDVEFAAFLEVPLTTIHQPRYRIGREATNILIDRISGKISGRTERIVLKPELIVRKST